jgi:AraC family transcriptional regulator
MSWSRIPKIVAGEEKCLAGLSLEMSFSRNRTFELWTRFMPRRRHFKNAVNNDLYSLQVYPDTGFFNSFDPSRPFKKWALLEVASFEGLPLGMEPFLLPAGTYAVFDFRGSSAEAPQAFRYIYGQWLPASGYVLADRPHFELLGARYKRDATDSEEEIWIPVQPAGS